MIETIHNNDKAREFRAYFTQKQINPALQQLISTIGEGPAQAMGVT